MQDLHDETIPKVHNVVDLIVEFVNNPYDPNCSGFAFTSTFIGCTSSPSIKKK